MLFSDVVVGEGAAAVTVFFLGVTNEEQLKALHDEKRGSFDVSAAALAFFLLRLTMSTGRGFRPIAFIVVRQDSVPLCLLQADWSAKRREQSGHPKGFSPELKKFQELAKGDLYRGPQIAGTYCVR